MLAYTHTYIHTKALNRLSLKLTTGLSVAESFSQPMGYSSSGYGSSSSLLGSRSLGDGLLGNGSSGFGSSLGGLSDDSFAAKVRLQQAMLAEEKQKSVQQQIQVSFRALFQERFLTCVLYHCIHGALDKCRQRYKSIRSEPFPVVLWLSGTLSNIAHGRKLTTLLKKERKDYK